ncbi:nitroreductase family protein [Ligilactobacillus sp. WILCCON 0076]|uniref:Nitroreductase family protein n=1 Tax=Ligilactobacillus ubinensis TaxID=2876789 RepID=A0A9X2JM85_9LACO|nr:nitroreductase family protein [Ligilactobacillus ubinensis]MCP0887758.1 nitroreductase family protein [Ligilactobacillus ubinensis]
MTELVVNALKKRRTIYALGENVKLTPEKISELIKEAIKYSPTAFNSQTVRAVILFGEKSKRVWDIVEQCLEKEVPNAEAFKKTKKKIETFRAGFGTILFFTDTAIVKNLEEKFPLYAENFYDWSEQGIGGAQQAVWVALAQENLGASLQHYNPLIDESIAKEFSIPKSWRLRAQMPFGSIESKAIEKKFILDEERVRIIK